MARGDTKFGRGARGGNVVPTTQTIGLASVGTGVALSFPSSVPIPFAFEVIGVTARHEVAGTDSGAVSVMLKKVPSGTAKASGTNVLAAGINLKAAANTNQAGTLHATQANRQGAAGDALALVPTGTLTALDGVGVTVEVRRL